MTGSRGMKSREDQDRAEALQQDGSGTSPEGVFRFVQAMVHEAVQQLREHVPSHGDAATALQGIGRGLNPQQWDIFEADSKWERRYMARKDISPETKASRRWRRWDERKRREEEATAAPKRARKAVTP